GVSQVVVEFDLKVNAKEAQNDVRDKVSKVRSKLPLEVEEPLIQRMDFADRPIMQMAFFARAKPASDYSEAAIRLIAEQKLKPLLQKVDGVGQIDIFGGAMREVHVDLDREKLMLWRLTPQDIAAAIRKANLNVPGGEIRESHNSRSLRLVGEFQSIADIED